MSTRRDIVTKKDLQAFKDEIIQQFHIISEGLIDQIKLLAEGHSGIIQRLDQVDTRLGGVETKLDGVETRLYRVETRLDQMEKENERQHLETRSLVKISISELDRRLSDLESQMKEVQAFFLPLLVRSKSFLKQKARIISLRMTEAVTEEIWVGS